MTLSKPAAPEIQAGVAFRLAFGNDERHRLAAERQRLWRRQANGDAAVGRRIEEITQLLNGSSTDLYDDKGVKSYKRLSPSLYSEKRRAVLDLEVARFGRFTHDTFILPRLGRMARDDD